MSGAIESVAASWLNDAPYVKVFKHTFDVVQDYVCYAMMAVGAISLSVKFLTTLGSGDVLCIIMGFVYNGTTSTNSLDPYSNSLYLPITSYAGFHTRCVDAALTTYMQHAPFFYLLQALLIIVIEKFFLKIPRVAGKIERFYNNIVQESLFGKDPDVAEDVYDQKSNPEAISRLRRRNEVCMSLKRSSVIHQTYIIKNILEMIILSVIIPVNLIYGVEAEKNVRPSMCILSTLEVPDLAMAPGFIHLQCEAKKVRFFIIILHVIVVTQIACFICCAGSLLWCLGFRSISRLLKSIEKVCFEYDLHVDHIEGEDFLFLFDLLAHTSGIESTLRVLTHSDETFRKICQPRLRTDNDHLKVEEDKLKVVWHAAAIEKWLVDEDQSEISVDSYDVTIFPAESIKNSVTKRAKLRLDPNADDVYSAWFFDLAGGKTEYIITIACVIGRSRMKGERVVTTLLPYGPEKPRGGMLKQAGSNEVEIAWEPPKGDFTKYVLSVDSQITTTLIPKKFVPNMYMFNVSPSFSTGSLPGSSNELQPNKGYRERELSSKLTSFTLTGLIPGETYGIQLKSKTGDRETRNAIFETVLTKPLPVTSLTVENIELERATLKWIAPENHTRLRAFNILVATKDNKDRKEMAVKHNPGVPINSFVVEHLQAATEFFVRVTTVCVFETLKTSSEDETTTFITPPPPPKNLELESRFCNSLTISWDTPAILVASQKYKLFIQSPGIGYNNQFEMTGERHTFNFSKLPEITGTGEIYNIRIVYVVVPLASDDEVESEPLTGSFATKPLPPNNFRLGSRRNEILWSKSATPRVNGYRVRYKSAEEGSKPEEVIVPVVEQEANKAEVRGEVAEVGEVVGLGEDQGDGEDEEEEEADPCSFILEDLTPDVMYKVNIYSLVEGEEGETIESKELHEKVILKDMEGLAIYEEPEKNPEPLVVNRQMSQLSQSGKQTERSPSRDRKKN